MRVAIAARNLKGGTGASMIVLKHIRECQVRGAAVDLYGEKLNAAAIEAHGATPVEVRRMPLFKARARRRFSDGFDRFVARGDYDLVVGNGDVLRQDVLFLHNLVRRECEAVYGRVPRHLTDVVELHDALLGAHEFALCIANSNLMRRDLIERYDVPAEKIHVVHPGFDPLVFNADQRDELRAAERAALGLGDDILVGFVTSGSFRKRGFDLLLETDARLDADVRARIKYLVVGTPKRVRQLMRRADRKRLAGRWLLVPPIAAVQRYYHALDLFFHPARIEEFGLVVQEAAACAVPVLTSRTVGAAELFADDDGAVVVEDAQPEQFAAGLTRLVSDAELRERFACAAERAVKHNDWQRYFRRVFDLYARELEIEC